MSNRISLNGSPKERKPTVSERDKLASQVLSTRYDALNQLITEAEIHLKLLKPLHSVWVEFGKQSTDSQPDSWEVLGLVKYNGQWRLCHAYDDDLNEYGPRELKPLIECPVDV